MTTITTQYSLWFLIPCLLAGLSYAVLLYRKDTKLTEAPVFAKRIMFIFRFLSVSIISFLLLSPFLRKNGTVTEKPYIIFAQDNSESLISDKNEIKEIYDYIKKEIKNNPDYKFVTYTFGEDVKKNDNFNFSEKNTDIASVIYEIKNKYYNRNAGVLILVSDGIYNKGNNPLNEIQNTDFPVYTIAVGDTSIQKDLILKNVKYNETAYLNSFFPLRIKIKANKLKGEKSQIKIFENNKLIKQQKFIINNDDYYKIFDFKIKAGKTGFHKYKIVLEKTKNEINYENNKKEIIIKVSDKKQKILILSDAPHPDIAAIKSALNKNTNYEIEYFDVNKFNKNINSYNLIILNQLPSYKNSALNITEKIIKSNIPVIFMIGLNTNLNLFDKLNTGLQTGAYSNSPDETSGLLNKKFDLFAVNPEIETITQNSPPLISPFGDYKMSVPNQILFFRKIKSINTNTPLIVFNTVSYGKKYAFVTGEGIWRWKLFDFKINQNNFLFNELINGIVQYLISGNIKNGLNITSENIFNENENVIFKAEISDDNKQNISHEINFILYDSIKNEKKYTFKKQKKQYILNLGKLPAGDYDWIADTKINNKKISEKGKFSVVSYNNEILDFKANHNLLYQIAENTGGKLLYPEEAKKIPDILKNNDNIKPVSYTEKKSEELINFKIIFFIILILLTTEWFLRKYFGAY